MSGSHLAKLPNISYTWRICVDNIIVEFKEEKKSPSFKFPLPDKKEATAYLKATIIHSKNEISLNTTLECETFYPIIVAEYRYSYLNGEAGIVLHAEKFNRIVLSYSGNSRNFSSCSLPLKKMKQHDLVDNMLAIRVDATCYHPIIAADKAATCKVPLDNVRKELHSLYKESVLADVTIVSQGKEFKAHKVVLASQSSVFRKMFEVDMKEKGTNTVEMPDISPPVISDLLNFIYTGETPNMKTMVKELINVADKYELPKLFNMCQEELRKVINPSNAVEIFSLAEFHRAEDLKKVCLEMIGFNFQTTRNSPGWVNLTEEEEKVLLYEVIALKK